MSLRLPLPFIPLSMDTSHLMLVEIEIDDDAASDVAGSSSSDSSD
jgi:hypothetical protein